MGKLRVVILSNENPDDHSLWIDACEDYKDEIDYRVVNITKNEWLDGVKKIPFDVLLTKPSGLTANFKQLYDERIFILGNIFGYKIFPSPMEIFIYENKRFLSYWLKANSLLHPVTNVFYDKKEAQEYINVNKFPIVAKTNIGASGSGVKLLRTKTKALTYINDTFTGKGAPQDRS